MTIVAPTVALGDCQQNAMSPVVRRDALHRSTRVLADAMILCVTLNPCLDKTLTVPPWRPGDLVRGTAVREVVGGKGNNVARALQRLGRDAAARHVPGRPGRLHLRSPAPHRRRARPARDPHRGADAGDPHGPHRIDRRADGVLRPGPGHHAATRPSGCIQRSRRPCAATSTP